TGTSDGQAETPGDSRVFINRAMPSSRLSTRATISSPCSFQSPPVEKENKRQPSASFAKLANDCHCSTGTLTTNGASPWTWAPPKCSPMSVAAWARVTVSVDLRVGFRPFACAPEVSDLILQEQEPVQQ